ncbi:hypothetical protein [Fredinandcohnia onubensis]|uniref:hypothetical protein n=1 Tax=Fredinandcohnia onubensis TaxID=1571209 RepID=UPI000C0BE519|nr:hypothetical protein [Fredinandcohnia onubensis]
MISNASEKIGETYQQAVESLKKLNNELFYDELKTNMERHEGKMQREYENVKNLLESLRNTIDHVPFQLGTMVEENNNKLVGLQEDNLDVLNKDVIKLFDEKKAQFDEILTGMGAFQQNLQTIFKHYKSIYTKQNERFDSFISNQEGHYNQFLQDNKDSHEVFKTDVVKTNEEHYKETIDLFNKSFNEVFKQMAVHLRVLEQQTTLIKELKEQLSLMSNQHTNDLQNTFNESKSHLNEHINSLTAQLTKYQETQQSDRLKFETILNEQNKNIGMLKKVTIGMSVGTIITLGALAVFL